MQNLYKFYKKGLRQYRSCSPRISEWKLAYQFMSWVISVFTSSNIPLTKNIFSIKHTAATNSERKVVVPFREHAKGKPRGAKEKYDKSL